MSQIGSTPSFPVPNDNDVMEKPKGTFKTLCKILEALGGNPAGCVGNKDVLDKIAISLGAASDNATKFNTEAMALIAGNIDDESPVEVAKLRNSFGELFDGTMSSFTDDATDSVRPFLFYECTSLTAISFESATNIGQGAFGLCTALESVNLPAARFLGEGAFDMCHNLSSIELPSVTVISEACFCDCQNLTNIDMPSIAAIGGYGFSGCSSLSSINLHFVQTIGSQAFYGCYNLSTVIMETGGAIPTLANSNAFEGTHSALTFYVHSDKISAFQAASNWSYFSSRFADIETLGSASASIPISDGGK